MDQSVLAQLVIIIWRQKLCTYIVLIKLFLDCVIYTIHTVTSCNLIEREKRTIRMASITISFVFITVIHLVMQIEKSGVKSCAQNMDLDNTCTHLDQLW